MVMDLLIPRLEQLLTEQFVTATGATAKAVRIAPTAWIDQNLNAGMFPLITIFEDQSSNVKGKQANCFDALMNVIITVWYNLTDTRKLLFGDVKRGIYPLSQAIFDYLNTNKKLHGVDPETKIESCVVSGINLPVEFRSFQIEFNKGSFYCTGRSMRVQFFRRHQLWASAENPERDAAFPSVAHPYGNYA